MAVHTLDLAKFRALFPEFANTTTYPDARIQLYWDTAGTIMGASDGPLLSGDQLDICLYYLAAHLLKTAVVQAAASGGGSAAGVVTGATIDKTSVTLAAPPFKDGWAYWLSTTPYGLELWALLSVMSAGGVYLGASNAIHGFRGPAGGFGPWG
jgi:hypothetical protein